MQRDPFALLYDTVQAAGRQCLPLTVQQSVLRKNNIRISDCKRKGRTRIQSEATASASAATNQNQRPTNRPTERELSDLPFLLSSLPSPRLSPFHPALPLFSSTLPHHLPPFPPSTSSSSCPRAYALLAFPSSSSSLWLFLLFFLKSHSKAMRNIHRSCPSNMSNRAMLIVPIPIPSRHQRNTSRHSQFPLSTSPLRVCDTETHRAVRPSPLPRPVSPSYSPTFLFTQPQYVPLPPSSPSAMAPLVRSSSAIGMGPYPPIRPCRPCSPSSVRGQSTRTCVSSPSSA